MTPDFLLISAARLVKMFVEEFDARGTYSVSRTGIDGSDYHVPSGAYFSTMERGAVTSAKKMNYRQ
ncbi:MAG TPA: hypothetical protein VMM57_01460 [Bacteroidota bacterium]|nr:hypothetical protein [Bacteroidota bacterium]